MVFCYFWKTFMAMGAPMEGYYIFLKFKDKRKTKRSKEKMSSFKEKIIKPPFLSNFICFSFLVHFEWFKELLVHHLKPFEKNFKCKDNIVMTNELELQNKNCFYVSKTSNPFISKMHILLILRPLEQLLWLWCGKWRITNLFEIVEQWPNFYESLSTSLPLLHIKFQL